MESFLGNFYIHLATIYWSHWLEVKVANIRSNVLIPLLGHGGDFVLVVLEGKGQRDQNG